MTFEGVRMILIAGQKSDHLTAKPFPMIDHLTAKLIHLSDHLTAETMSMDELPPTQG